MNAGRTLGIYLFGGGRALADDEPIKLPKRATAFALLAMLIARFGQPVSRTFLAFTLFPDVDEEGALKELRRYLYLTAKALPQPDGDRPWFVVDQETVRWNETAPAFVDVREFERLAASQATYAEAVDLYAGDLLEDIYDDWIVVERERLRARNLTMLQALIERHRAARDHAAAVAYAKRLLAFDPLREDVVRQVMAVRYAAGDSSGALAEFDRFVRRLRDDVGVAPMSETVALRETILRELPLAGSVDRVSHEIPAASRPRAHRLPFVGRADELARLTARWDRAARGFGNSTFVGGEAGVGKTRLVGELARLVEAQGGRVFSGGTSSTEAMPYQCLVEALRAALPVLASNRLNALTLRVLARTFPELEARASAPTPLDALEPEREAARLYGAFAAAIEALASPRPLLLVLEDVHWASASTIDALATLARRVDGARIMIVATYREEESAATHPLRRLVTALGIERRMLDLHLGRFERDDVRRAIDGADGADGFVASADVVDRLYALSEGNPLFLTEAIASVVETGAAPQAPVFATGGGIEAIVASRVARLGDAARAVAEIAATCGDGCTLDVVRDVAGFSGAETLDAVGELLERRIVREAGSRERFEYVFSHNVIGAAIYRRMPEHLRVRRHGLLARYLERLPSPDVAQVRDLARHLAAAGSLAAAARYDCRAAREAAALYANDDAVAFASLAIERTDDPALRIEALFVREEANARLGQRHAQERDLATLLASDLDAETRCRALRRVVALRRAGDDRASEAEAIDAFNAAAIAADDPSWRAAAMVDDARYRIAIGQTVEGNALAVRARNELDPASRIGVEAICAHIDAEMALGAFVEAERSIAALLASAHASSDRVATCEALLRSVSLATMRHEFDRAASEARELLEHYRVMGDRLGESRALSSIAGASVRHSRFREGREANAAAAAISEEIGDRAGVARAELIAGMLASRCGDLLSARASLVSARAHFERLGDRRAVAVSLLNEGCIALWQGASLDAKDLSSQALETARAIEHSAYVASSLANLGAAERDLGEFDAAIAHLSEAHAMQERLHRTIDRLSDLADLALAYGLCGEIAAALEFVERILRLDRALVDAEVIPAYPIWMAACVLHWAGDPRTGEVLAWAWRLARAFADTIELADDRRRFEAWPFYVALARAYEHDVWPEPRARARATDGPGVASEHESAAAELG